MPKRAAIFTLGCRANQYDELIICRSLENAGFEIVPFDETAELYVINTCTVTHRGDADSRKAARNALRRNPDAFVVIAGCYPQHDSRDIAEIPGVDLIIGNREKLEIAKYLPENLAKNRNAVVAISDPDFPDAFGEQALVPIDRSRALLKIQDGCDQFCSYCIVPYVRGKPRSLDKQRVLARVAELVAVGFREIVITGIHLGIWGREFGENLESLVGAIDGLEGEFRIRFSSIEPMEITDGFIETILDSPRICRHLHIPIQSACDSVLKRMNRPYTVDEIRKLFQKIKSIEPAFNIGTDLIIGFPGESAEDFEKQLEELADLPVDYFHLFTYSPRKGTAIAASKVERVSHEKIKSRLDILKVIDRKRRERFLKSQENSILTFVVEHAVSKKKDIIIGLSDNYLRAQLDGGAVREFGFVRARLAKTDGRTPLAVLQL